MQLSDFLVSNTGVSGRFQLKAGATISQNDIVELGPDGRAYTVACSDYAAVANFNNSAAQTSAATGMIVAQTQIVASATTALYRQAVLQGVDGSIYAFTSGASLQGLLLSRYSTTGGLLGQATVDSTTATYTNTQMFFLSNGNICVLSTLLAGGIYFAIYDVSLTQIKALTVLTENEVSNQVYFHATPMSGGGFAIVYNPNLAALTTRLVTYDNTGTLSLPPTTIWTRTGTTGTQIHRITQLANGNLVVAILSQNGAPSSGLFYGIFTVLGVAVMPFANLDSSSSSAVIPDISVMAGYFAISKTSSGASAAFQMAWVFDNTGALQGSPFSVASSGQSSLSSKLLNDGSAFWLIWSRNSDQKVVLTKIPIVGSGYTSTQVTTGTTPTNYAAPMDAFFENGCIVLVYQVQGINSYPMVAVISTITQAILGYSLFGVQSGTALGQYQRVIPGGDFSFICMYDYSSTASTNLCVGKYANTAVMGVAQASGSANSLVPVIGSAGGYVANTIKGSPSKQFDHSATNITGNRGSLMTYGAVLKGF